MMMNDSTPPPMSDREAADVLGRLRLAKMREIAEARPHVYTNGDADRLRQLERESDALRAGKDALLRRDAPREGASVDDAMVERACVARHGPGWLHTREDWRESDRAEMREILTAALRAPEPQS